MLFEDWGLIPYQQALDRQLKYVSEVIEGAREDTLVFCTHPPVVTLGRVTKPEDIFGWKGETLEVSRGGRATYHGPSQLVIYPILNLDKTRAGRKPRDIVGYLRVLENAIVDTLAEYGIQATGKSLQPKHKVDGDAEETGVWVANRKIASLGIAVKRWVTYHGAAINLEYDPEAFKGMNPCGFSSQVMISLEQVLERPIDRARFAGQLKNKLDL